MGSLQTAVFLPHALVPGRAVLKLQLHAMRSRPPLSVWLRTATFGCCCAADPYCEKDKREHQQWFYFRVSNCADETLNVRFFVYPAWWCLLLLPPAARACTPTPREATDLTAPCFSALAISQVRITNAGQCSYPSAWKGYSVCTSYDKCADRADCAGHAEHARSPGVLLMPPMRARTRS